SRCHASRSVLERVADLPPHALEVAERSRHRLLRLHATGKVVEQHAQRGLKAADALRALRVAAREPGNLELKIGGRRASGRLAEGFRTRGRGRIVVGHAGVPPFCVTGRCAASLRYSGVDSCTLPLCGNIPHANEIRRRNTGEGSQNSSQIRVMHFPACGDCSRRALLPTGPGVLTDGPSLRTGYIFFDDRRERSHASHRSWRTEANRMPACRCRQSPVPAYIAALAVILLLFVPSALR